MRRRLTCLFLAAAAGFLRAPALAQEDDRRHWSAGLYFFAASASGTVSVRGVPPIPFEAPLSDTIQNLDLAFIAHGETRKGRLGFGLDLNYIDLGTPVPSSGILGAASPKLDILQIVTQGFAFWRASAWGTPESPGAFDLLGGLHYFHVRTRLEGTTRNGEDLAETTADTMDFVNLMLGMRVLVPLGSAFSVSARSDVALGDSSDSWELVGDVWLSLGKGWSVGAGYRYLKVDYEKGSGPDRTTFKPIYRGPQIRFLHAW